MPRFPVTPAKQQALEQRMAAVGLREHELEEHFFHGNGRIKGGCKGVLLRHPRLGLEIRCQEASSQGLNRFHARRRLVEACEARARGATQPAASPTGPISPAKSAAKPKKKPGSRPGPKPVSELVKMFHLPPPPPLPSCE